MSLNFEREKLHFAECLKGMKPKETLGEVARALDEKNKEISILKLKNEQLREKELYARLQLDACPVSNRELKNEIMKLSSLQSEYSIDVQK